MKGIKLKYIISMIFLVFAMVLVLVRISHPERSVAYSRKNIALRYSNSRDELRRLLKIRDSLLHNRFCSAFTVEYTGKRFIQSCDSFLTPTPVPRNFTSDDFLSYSDAAWMSNLMYKTDIRYIGMDRISVRISFSTYFNKDFSAGLRLFKTNGELVSFIKSYITGLYFQVDTNAIVTID